MWLGRRGVGLECDKGCERTLWRVSQSPKSETLVSDFPPQRSLPIGAELKVVYSQSNAVRVSTIGEAI